MSLPLGPQVDGWPRPLPLRQKFKGQRATLEPLARRHAAELFEAAQFAADSFTYVGFGPWPHRTAIEALIATICSDPNAVFWAVRPVTTGRVCGFLSLKNIAPANAAIEIGDIWFGPELRHTRAATEAVFLLLCHAMDDLGYRRLAWTCDALNQPARRAALRLGFTYEGTLRAHGVVKGHQYDSAMFSLLAAEWPTRRAALMSWLEAENFDNEGNAIRALHEIREQPNE